MGAVTLKDLAGELGLSITTVSRALAGYGDVAEATRQRVLQAAEEMGYVPDATARRLQKGRTDTLGFVLPTTGPRLSDPFFSELLAGIGNTAAQ
ncbi:LacI family DNA-binding transcriptional regulator, partial [Chloroflexota bacterium]